jgi:hypothetical protein
MTLVRNTAIGVCIMLAGAIAMAQTPSQPSTSRQTSQPGLQGLDGQTVTVTGCLMREADVPGRQPTPTERAGVLPDFILTNVQVKSASPSGESPSGGAAGTRPGAASAAGGTNIKLVKVDNDEMKANVNRQVEVTGRLDVDGGAMGGTRTGTPGTTGAPGAKPGTEATGGTRTGAGAKDQDRPLPELEVQSVRATGQPCTAPKQ